MKNRNLKQTIVLLPFSCRFDESLNDADSSMYYRMNLFILVEEIYSCRNAISTFRYFVKYRNLDIPCLYHVFIICC